MDSKVRWDKLRYDQFRINKDLVQYYFSFQRLILEKQVELYYLSIEFDWTSEETLMELKSVIRC